MKAKPGGFSNCFYLRPDFQLRLLKTRLLVTEFHWIVNYQATSRQYTSLLLARLLTILCLLKSFWLEWLSLDTILPTYQYLDTFLNISDMNSKCTWGIFEPHFRHIIEPIESNLTSVTNMYHNLMRLRWTQINWVSDWARGGVGVTADAENSKL